MCWQALLGLLVHARQAVYEGVGQAVTALMPATGVVKLLFDASVIGHVVELPPSAYAKVKLAFLNPLDRPARVAAARAIYTDKKGAVLKFRAALALGKCDLTRVEINLFFERAATT